ncbi:MAG TPA: hypothetical protein VL463_22540 [Kofleriaceae bacterium]|nr:hypothetical protein [Kofleriaceae bacterium]
MRWSVIAIVACACRGTDPPPPAPHTAPPAPRRVLGPAPGGVRALPPHAIRGDGVGPYRLGRPLGEILADLPLGPSIATLDIPGVVGTSVVRAEEGAVLIDGESQGEASFLAVVRPDIARTESGIMVGSTREDLERALGPQLIDHRRARDPRIWVGHAMPSVRFVVENDHIVAVFLARGPGAVAPGTKPVSPPDAGVPASDALPECDAPAAADAIAVIASKPGVPIYASPWCTGEGAALTAVATEGVVTLIGAADGHPHKVGALDAPGVVWAGAIADDDRDDLAVVSERGGADARTIELTIYRMDAGRPSRVAEQDLYRLTAQSARWIGAKLEDVEILIELDARDENVVATGAMVSRAGGEIRDVAPLVPVEVVRRRRAITPDLDAGHPTDDAHR